MPLGTSGSRGSCSYWTRHHRYADSGLEAARPTNKLRLGETAQAQLETNRATVSSEFLENDEASLPTGTPTGGRVGQYDALETAQPCAVGLYTSMALAKVQPQLSLEPEIEKRELPYTSSIQDETSTHPYHLWEGVDHGPIQAPTAVAV